MDEYFIGTGPLLEFLLLSKKKTNYRRFWVHNIYDERERNIKNFKFYTPNFWLNPQRFMIT